MTLNETVLENVARIRDANPIKGIELAKRLGVTPPTVVKILKDGAKLQCETVDRLAAALGVPTNELTTPAKKRKGK